MLRLKKSTMSLLGLAALGVGGYEIYKHTGPASRRAAAGDTVIVDATKLGGVAPAGIPAGVSSIAVQLGTGEVNGVLPGSVVGYVVNGGIVPFPATAAINVPRTAITGIVKNGQITA
jgi:hypothetical protein